METQSRLRRCSLVTLGSADCKCILCLQEGAANSQAMEVKGMWPYWKEGTDTQTVRNTFTLDRIVMFTGAPHMSCLSIPLVPVGALQMCHLYTAIGVQADEPEDNLFCQWHSGDIWACVSTKTSQANSLDLKLCRLPYLRRRIQCVPNMDSFSPTAFPPHRPLLPPLVTSVL